MNRIVVIALAGLALVGMAASPPVAPPAPEVEMLRVQNAGGHIYFHVRFKTPAGLVRVTRQMLMELGSAPDLTPRLVGPEGKAWRICTRMERPADPRPLGAEEKAPRGAVPLSGLEFVGRCDADGPAVLTLLYAEQGGRPPQKADALPFQVEGEPGPIVWREVKVRLDFGKAARVAVPKEAGERAKALKKDETRHHPVADDLEGLWAAAQSDEFRRRARRGPAIGFHDFASRAVGRKYGIRGAPLDNPELPFLRRAEPSLYDLTTGAAAMSETLQMRRMTSVRPEGKPEPRDKEVSKLAGIDVAEHPWKKMMAGKKPAAEPLADAVPHDNYYVSFRRLDRMAELAALMGGWGGSLLNSYEMACRDYRHWERYERQLCLSLAALAEKMPADAIHGVALTGSDAYLREGSDLTAVFHVADPRKFNEAVTPIIDAALAARKADLKAATAKYQGVEITSAVSTLREVSLYRARVGELALFSNSPAGIRRVITAALGKGKRLSESLDFRYMRTVFRADEKGEDGFAFLSDPFIRNMVGPAMKIKQRRRFEAIASLHMLTHGAMLAQWESGKPARTVKDILDRTSLAAWELPVPDGSPATWDAGRGLAVSDAYGTIHFSTPLVEIPIDKVTATEAEEYERYRLEYLGLWRQYFDPMGFRVKMSGGEVKVDTYILPLVENSAYNALRRLTGGREMKLAPATLSKTLFQYATRLSPDERDREEILPLGQMIGGGKVGRLLGRALDPVGDWFLFRLDDGPAVADLLDLANRTDRGERVSTWEVMRHVWALPLAAGVDVKNRVAAAGWLAAGRAAVLNAASGLVTWEPLEKQYKGVSIIRIQATEAGKAAAVALVNEVDDKPFRPALYYAMTDAGLWMTLNEGMMRRLIDEVAARKGGKEKTVAAATSLHLSPGTATLPALKRYLEHSVSEAALSSEPAWHALYSSGVAAPDASASDAAETAYRWLGFVPVSPDGAAFRWDGRTAEAVNARHGTIRRPLVPRKPLKDSPVARLLDSLGSVRADLRFREDGIHTVVTLKMRK
jgi:hypothetical protein